MTPRLTHFAINTDDVAATQVFYGSVFGWTFRAYGPPGFVQILDETGEALMEPVAIPEVGQLMAFRDPGRNPVLAMQYDLD